MRRRSLPIRVAALALAGAALVGSTASGADERPVKKPPVRLVVTFAKTAPAAARAEATTRTGRVVDEIPALRSRVVEVPAAAARGMAKRLRADDAVAFVEVDAVRTVDQVVPNDPSPNAASLDRVDLYDAWEYTTGTSSVVIAVIDTGVDVIPPELPASRIVTGRNVITGTSNTGDDNGHGTAAASIAAMTGNNGRGAVGGCWSCSIMPIKALASNGAGLATDVAEGIVWAVDHGADIVNLSLSGRTSQVEKNAIDWAESHGVVVVAAAGNNTSTAPVYPAGHNSVVGVAASQDDSDAAATYTNRGSWVKVAAPGLNNALGPSGQVSPFAGTSSAAPLVSGIVGLLLSENPSLSTSDVRALLMNTAVDVPYVSSAGGRVDADAALAAVPGAGFTAPPPATIDTTPSPDPGGTPTDVIGGGYTSSGIVTRSLTARSGVWRFEGRCSWCGGMTLQILDADGAVVASLAGDRRFALEANLPSSGTYFFRITAKQWGAVTYFISYRS